MSVGTVLHLSPHPDDELIGTPATLMALRDEGWRVVNLACGLGAPEQRQRREAELREACRRAGFELLVPEPLPRIDQGADRAAARAELTAAIGTALGELRPQVVVAPSPGDVHPTHELVGEVAGEALAARGADGPRLWLWSLWGPPPRPTFATGFGEERLGEILHALAAHRGELERNDYARLVRARAEAAACLAPELLDGFGAAGSSDSLPYAELLTEVSFRTGGA